MAKLILSLNATFKGEYPVNKDRITIGRRPANDIHLDNLGVSGYHAAIVTIGNDSFLEDIDSTNGTYVNGKAIKRHVLKHGDRIEFGPYQIRYVNPGADELEEPQAQAIAENADVAEDQEAEAVPIIQPVRDKPMDAAGPSVTPVASIRVLSGMGAGRELVLKKTLNTFGKPGVQVAVITRRADGFYLSHVEGQDVPKLNGAAIGNQARLLKNQDIVELAGVTMEFQLEQAGS